MGLLLHFWCWNLLQSLGSPPRHPQEALQGWALGPLVRPFSTISKLSPEAGRRLPEGSGTQGFKQLS